MPRLTHQTPKYRKHKASGQAFVELNGHRHHLGPHGTKTSKLDYDRLIGEWLTSGRSCSFGVSAAQITVVELAADYLKYARSYHGTDRNSELHRIVTVLRPLLELYGRTSATDFGVLELKVVRQRFLDQDHSRTYINASIKRIVRMFRWAASEGRLSPSVPQALEFVPGLRRGKTTARETKPILPVEDSAFPGRDLPVVSDLLRTDAVKKMKIKFCRAVSANASAASRMRQCRGG